jgi:hypothetical protein
MRDADIPGKRGIGRMAGAAVRTRRRRGGLSDDLEHAVEPGSRLQERQQPIALAPGQMDQTSQKLVELPCSHNASVNGSGRHWTGHLPKRFHT